MTDISLTSTVLQQELSFINPHPVKRQVDMRGKQKSLRDKSKSGSHFKNCTCHFMFEEEDKGKMETTKPRC